MAEESNNYSPNMNNIFFFLGPHPQHMEVPRLRVKSELQLPAYATAIAMPDPSRVCHLRHSSWQWQILNPLIEAMDRTHNLLVPSRIYFRCAMTRTLYFAFVSCAYSTRTFISMWYYENFKPAKLKEISSEFCHGYRHTYYLGSAIHILSYDAVLHICPPTPSLPRFLHPSS